VLIGGRRIVGVKLARIEEVVRIQRPLDGLHQLDCPRPKLFVQVFFLPNPNTMLAGTYSSIKLD